MESLDHFLLVWSPMLSVAVANFGVQYNYDSVGPAEEWLGLIYWDDANYSLLLKVIIFIGTIIGMITFGAMGDLMGVEKGLFICQAFQVLGALLQGVVSWGGGSSVYCILIAVRTLIGIGAGGVYPLAAAKSAQASHSVDPVHKAQAVAWGFLWRNVGAAAVWVNALIMFYTLGAFSDQDGNGTEDFDEIGAQISWRYVLMFGALAPCVVMIIMKMQPTKVAKEDEERTTQLNSQRITTSRNSVAAAGLSKDQASASGGLLEEIKNHPGIVRKMLGTGGGWLFFDWSFYGNHLLSGKILKIILPGDMGTSGFLHISFDVVGIIVVLFAIPLFSYAGVRWLQFWGFAGTAVTTLLIGVLWPALINNINGVLLLLYYLSYGTYWIANVTTYTMSTLLYPPTIRGTMNGLSAACGKVGAIIGVTLFTKMFEVCDTKVGLDHDTCINDTVPRVMYISMATGLCGMLVTLYGCGLERTGSKSECTADQATPAGTNLKIPYAEVDSSQAEA